MKNLLKDIRACGICHAHLPLAPNPVVVAHPNAKVVIIGQAPGTKVHKSSIPWDDQSGKQLRRWLDVTDEAFYNPENIAIVPMGFCYPGKGKSGDLPPRPECAPQWHKALLSQMPNVKLVLLIGAYAQKYYLKDKVSKTLTETVQRFSEFGPMYFPLPHPSPRNRFWLSKNPWFEKEVIPVLRSAFAKANSNDS